MLFEALPAVDKDQEEQSLDVRQMALLFINSVIFIKIPLLFFGFRMSEEPTLFNIGAFSICLLFTIVNLARFLWKKTLVLQMTGFFRLRG